MFAYIKIFIISVQSWFLKFGIIFTFIIISNSCTPKTENGTHLFILSGQSNMANLDPSISFKPNLENLLSKENIIIVKYALGSQPIYRWYKEWTYENGMKPENSGDLYDSLMRKVTKAIKGKKIKSVTFVWMQGERDAKLKYGDAYEKSLVGLIKQLSDDLQWNELNVVIGRLNDYSMDNNTHPHWTVVRETQVKVAESIKRGGWVDTDDLNGVKNDIHCTEEGYFILGERFANKAITIIENNK